MKIEETIAHSNAIEGEPMECDKHSLEAWEFLKEQGHLTAEVIIHAHWLLAGHQLGPKGHIKGFRKQPVWIGGHEAHEYERIPEAIDMWLDDWHHNPNSAPVGLHVDFEHIHPFVDGNGRIGRLLMYFMQEQAGVKIRPILLENRQAYYNIF